MRINTKEAEYERIRHVNIVSRALRDDIQGIRPWFAHRNDVIEELREKWTNEKLQEYKINERVEKIIAASERVPDYSLVEIQRYLWSLHELKLETSEERMV